MRNLMGEIQRSDCFTLFQRCRCHFSLFVSAHFAGHGASK